MLWIAHLPMLYAPRIGLRHKCVTDGQLPRTLAITMAGATEPMALLRHIGVGLVVWVSLRTMRLSSVRRAARPLIRSLLGPGSPPAVAGFVIPVNVDAIQGVAIGTLP